MIHEIKMIPGVFHFKDSRHNIPRHEEKKYDKRELGNITHISIADSIDDLSIEQLADYFIEEKNHAGIGYHFVIDKDGTVNWTNDLETISYHTAGYNNHSLGILMIGNFAKENPSKVQMNSLHATLRYLSSLLSIDTKNILGQHEFGGLKVLSINGWKLDMDEVRTNYFRTSAIGGHEGAAYTGGFVEGWNKNTTALADEIAIQYGVNPVIVKATVHAETSGNNISHEDSGRYAFGYGQVQVGRWWYNITKETAKEFDLSIGPRPMSLTEDKNMVPLFENNPRFSMAVAVKIIKQKWEASGQDWVKFTKSYVGAGIPYKDLERRRKIWEKWKAAVNYKDGTKYEMPNEGWTEEAFKARQYKDGEWGGSNNASGDGEYIKNNDPTTNKRAPYVYDDEYPPHRVKENPFSFRIGDSQFFLPPESMMVHKESDIGHKELIRSKSPIQTKSGHSSRTIYITLFFDGADMINGYPVVGPKGQIYYMDGLRSLVAQFTKNPFLPVVNEWLNYHHGIYNVGFKTIHVNTVDEFDGVLEVTLELLECTVEPFVQYPDMYYDDLFMYPLFRWWYQQLLNDKRESAYSSTFLRPVPNGMFHGRLGVKILSREKLEAFMEEVEIENPYALSQMKLHDIESDFMIEYPISDPRIRPSPIIQKVEVLMNKTLAPIHMTDQEIACYQDMGGTNKMFGLTMLCDRTELDAINYLSEELEGLSRDYRRRFVSGFMRIDNDIINMMGIHYGMIFKVESRTLNNDPAYEDREMFEVVVWMRAFDPTQKNNERLAGVNNKIKDADEYYKLSSPILNNKTEKRHEIFYETKMEKLLELHELYPDLELPTYDTINEIIPAINQLRKNRGFEPLPINMISKPSNGNFVDPDFYFAYPPIDDLLGGLELKHMGNKVAEYAMTGALNPDLLKENSEITFQHIIDTLQDEVVDNWKDEGFLDLRSVTLESKIDVTGAGDLYTLPVGKMWTKDFKVPEGNDAISRMCHDMVRYNKTGRMIKAFPTYLLIFIEEGMWLDGVRLWNHYYTYHGLEDISVVSDKNNPVDLAYIRLSNIYGAFDWQTGIADPRGLQYSKSFGSRISSMKNNLFMDWSGKDIKEWTEMLDHAKIKAGARVHIRMGYGSTAADLPISFNGQVAEVNDGEQIELVCQGDGAELVNQMLSYEPGSSTVAMDGENFGGETRNAFKNILTKRKSDFWFMTSEQWNFFDNQESKFGIEHFGVVESYANHGFWATLGDHFAFTIGQRIGNDDGFAVNVYDVMKNIYLGNGQPYTDEEWLTDGEHNIGLTTFNKTAWDIFQAHANFNREYICAIHPHGFRSTLFFGEPQWMVKYGYRLKSDVNNWIDPNSLDKFSSDSYVELAKPFQQFHMINSTYDIISNNVKASSEHLKHIAVGVYARGSGEDVATSIPVYADRTIINSEQKTMLIDTLVSQNYFGPDWLVDKVGRSTLGTAFQSIGDAASIAKDLTNWIKEETPIPGIMVDLIAPVAGALSKFADTYNENYDADRQFNIGDITARDVSIGALQRAFMEMYQGEIIILGNSAIRPWHISYVADQHQAMIGTIQIGKVVHSMNHRQGFISTIKPDLLTTRSDGFRRNEVVMAATGLGIYFGQMLLRKLIASNAAKAIGKFTLRYASNRAKAMGKGISSMASKEYIRNVIKKLPETTRMQTKKAADGTKSAVSRFFSNYGDDIGKGAKGVLRSNLLLATLLGFAFVKIERWYLREFGFNNTLYIHPLWKMGKPFAAGITGAKHIIPGYIDPQTTDGVEIPEQDWTDIDYSEVAKKKAYNNASAESDMNNYNSAYSNMTLVSAKTISHPVPTTQGISSAYGMRTLNGEKEMHHGVDFKPQATSGPTVVVSMGKGKVTKVVRQEHASAGKYVNIEHKIRESTVTARYLHLADIHPDIKEGSTVKVGQPIGIMGKTGRTTGVHLHFEIKQNGKHLNPVSFLAMNNINAKKPR